MSQIGRKNHYEVLDSSPTATDLELKKKKTKLLKYYHPDRFQNDPEMRQDAEERTKEINIAWGILGDPERRAEYNRMMGYPPPPEAEMENWYRQASRALDAGRWQEAVDLYNRILQRERSFRDTATRLQEARRRLEEEKRLKTLYDEASQAYRQEQWQEAISKFEEILRAVRGYRDVDTRLQEVRLRLERETRLRRLAKLYDQALGHIGAEQWDQAIRCLTEITSEDPRYRDSSARLGKAREQVELAKQYEQAKALLHSEQFAEASAVLESIVRKEPSYRDAPALLDSARRQQELADLYQQGIRASGQRRWDEALKAFKQVTAMDPEYRDTKSRLAQARMECADALYRKGAEHVAGGRYVEAVDCLRGALDAVSEHKEAILLLATVQAAGKTEQSVASQQKWLAAMQHRFGTLLLLGGLLLAATLALAIWAAVRPSQVIRRPIETLVAAQHPQSPPALPRQTSRSDSTPFPSISPDLTLTALSAAAQLTTAASDAPAALASPTPWPSIPYAGLPVREGTPVPKLHAAIALDNVDELVELARWGRGQVKGASWSPDGSWLAVASTIGVWLHSTQVVTEPYYLDTYTTTTGVRFAPDGSTLLICTGEGTSQLWGTEDRALLYDLVGHTDCEHGAAYSPDGRIVATDDREGLLRLWRVSDGTLLHSLEGDASYTTAVAFSPDGGILASGRSDGTLRLWRVDDGTQLFTSDKLDHARDVVIYSPDGAHLAVGSRYDCRVDIRRASDGLLLRTLEAGVISATRSPLTPSPREEDAECTLDLLAFSPDGSKLSSGSRDSDTVQTWQVSDGTLLSTTMVGAAWRAVKALSPDGRVLASDGFRAIELWQMADWTLLHSLGKSQAEEPAFADIELTFSPNGAFLVAVRKTGDTVEAWRVSDGKQVDDLELYRGTVSMLTFDPTGQSLVWKNLSTRGQQLWWLESGRFADLFDVTTSASSGCSSFSPDGNLLAVVTRSTVQVLHSSTKSVLYTLDVPLGTPVACFSPVGFILVTGESTGTIRFWEAQGGTPLRSLRGHRAAIESLAFTDDGKLLASGSSDGTVRLWGVIKE